MTITIRPVKDVEGSLHFQELQHRVWGADPIDVVPNHVTITVSKNGGLLLGAYADDGPSETGGMVGAVFWWLGTDTDPSAPPDSLRKLKACSHILGVLPEWQGQRIGLRLKLAQRQAVLEQGLTDWVTWTYDPLFRANGVFNIHRLGATCNTYMRNIYGELRDELNAGVPSDRCQVDWRLNSPHVLHDIEPKRQNSGWKVTGMHLLPVGSNATGFLQPIEHAVLLDGRLVAVPIPDDISAIRRADAGLSIAWRLYLRTVLEQAFDAGYTMVDCIHLPVHFWRYILVREYP